MRLKYADAAAVTILCVLLLVVGGWQLWRLVAVELQFPDYGHGDAAVFLAMGRAVLNGLTPYVDLFETKPPGIFLITALSLAWDNDITVARLLQAAVIGGIPLVLLGAAWRRFRSLGRKELWIVLTVAAVFGVALALFSGLNAGHFHTESFGAFFGLLYVCIAAVLPPTVRWRHVALLAVPLLLSVGTKEPFVLPLLASALLLRPGWRGVRDVFVLPLLAAAGIGIVLLGTLGMVRAYAGTYLPYMLLEHQQLVSARVDLLPFPLRGFDLPAYMQGLLSPPLFVVPVTLLWVVAFLRNAIGGWRAVAAVAVSLWLVVLAAEMAERNAHQQVIAVPAYAALLLTALSFWTQRWTPGRRRLWQGAFACALVPPLLLAPSPPSQGALVQAGQDDRRVREAAAEVDRVLDACGMERYVVLSVLEDQIYAYTEHSPLPMGLLQHIFRQNIGLDTFRADMRRSMEQTEVLLLRDGDLLTPEIARYIQGYFTVSPPACAGDVSLPEPMVLLFRERPHGSVPGS